MEEERSTGRESNVTIDENLRGPNNERIAASKTRSKQWRPI